MTATITPTCARGHELVGDNAIPRAKGGFRCRTCKRAASRLRDLRRREGIVPNVMPPSHDGRPADWSWLPQSRCAGVDTGGSATDRFFRTESERDVPPRIRRAARLFCADCPVRRECGDAATADRAVGLWGGAYRSLDSKSYRLIPLIAGDNEEVQA